MLLLPSSSHEMRYVSAAAMRMYSVHTTTMHAIRPSGSDERYLASSAPSAITSYPMTASPKARQRESMRMAVRHAQTKKMFAAPDTMTGAGWPPIACWCAA